jgi:hypothetical protein
MVLYGREQAQQVRYSGLEDKMLQVKTGVKLLRVQD